MQTAAPSPLRIGTLVRTAATSTSDVGAACEFFSFVDLNYPDGRVERWIGSSCEEEFDEVGRIMARARDHTIERAEDLQYDFRVAFGDLDPAQWEDLPIEIVFQWRCRHPERLWD